MHLKHELHQTSNMVILKHKSKERDKVIRTRFRGSRMEWNGYGMIFFLMQRLSLRKHEIIPRHTKHKPTKTPHLKEGVPI